MNCLYLAPHNDDEVLWGTFTLLREKPLVVVVTDSYIQENRGEDITADQRWIETLNAMKIVDCLAYRMGIRDDNFSEQILIDNLLKFSEFDTIYAPAIQGGNNQHDIVGKVADKLWGDRCKHYTTYTKTEPYTKGNIEISPTPEELDLKTRVMACYKTQLGNTNKTYFEAVYGKSEWLI